MSRRVVRVGRFFFLFEIIRNKSVFCNIKNKEYLQICAPKWYTIRKLFVNLQPENKTDSIMVVVTGRDFRANTAKYVDVAYRGEDVVVKSRAGSFRIVPVTEDDVVINGRDLAEELRGALMEAKESMEGKRKLNTLDNLINELRNSND
jgi:antitoxin (DNA-binding transcriptional repressor) of toxin-antitoxin stability system